MRCGRGISLLALKEMRSRVPIEGELELMNEGIVDSRSLDGPDNAHTQRGEAEVNEATDGSLERKENLRRAAP